MHSYRCMYILYRPFQDHSNTYLYVNYSMKTFRFSLTPRVRKTKSNTTTIIQHAHVCVYISICVIVRHTYQHTTFQLLFTAYTILSLCTGYVQTKMYFLRVTLARRRMHYIILLFYYNIIQVCICGYRRRRCVLLLRDVDNSQFVDVYRARGNAVIYICVRAHQCLGYIDFDFHSTKKKQ